MGKNVAQVTGEDNVKRVKIMLLSFGIAFSLFFTKIFARGGGLANIYLIGSIYALVAIVGLVWAFNFTIRPQSIKYIFQGGLFVFSEVVFVLLFFFKQFDRIYEGLLLVVLLMFLGGLTYVCFLMINIFNVSLFKELPLLNVAQTASYILTLLMIYFLTFDVLASGFPLYVIFPILFLIYVFLLHTEFNEIDIEKGNVWYLVIIVVLLNLFLLLPFVFVGSSHEVIAVVPTIASFVGGGLLTVKERDNAKWQVFIYNLLILMIVFIAVYLSWY